MTDSYLNAPATKMLATNCVCCGRPLVDALSVTLGIGPECRKGMDGGVSDEVRKEANKRVFDASMAAQGGHVERVIECADAIEALGLGDLAGKVRSRFKRIHDRPNEADIVIEIEGGMFRVKTPYRRGRAKEFIKAWRSIPGRRYRDGRNYVPLSEKDALWALLREYFPGRSGLGPKGVFRVPGPEPEVKQSEMELTAKGA